MSAEERLNQAFINVPILPLSKDSKYVLFSDCHRGDGFSNDNFLKNQNLYLAALQSYERWGFTYLELGDGDELWEGRSFTDIRFMHADIFQILSKLYNNHRLLMLYGNHDLLKKEKPFLFDFPAYSGCILKNDSSHRDIYLTHGHQADFWNSVLWKVSRFLVRYIWKPLERIGFLAPLSNIQNYSKKQKIEQTLSDWAEKNHCILITGHTHRPMLNKSGVYHNTGSCVYPGGITCIEINHFQLYLVKWTFKIRLDQSLYVARTVLSGPVQIL